MHPLYGAPLRRGAPYIGRSVGFRDERDAEAEAAVPGVGFAVVFGVAGWAVDQHNAVSNRLDEGFVGRF